MYERVQKPKCIEERGHRPYPSTHVLIVHALPSAAKHARTEATRFVTADCAQHILKAARKQDQQMYTPRTEECT